MVASRTSAMSQIIPMTIYNVAISGLQESAEINVYNNSIVADVTTFLGLGSIRHNIYLQQRVISPKIIYIMYACNPVCLYYLSQITENNAILTRMLNNNRQPTKLNHFSGEKVKRGRACKTDLCNSKDGNIPRLNWSRV